MPSVTCLYLDDSGTRNPNHKPSKDQFRDWFSLGGIMIKEEDEPHARALHAAFCARWNITYPLHSSEIRTRSENFSWLRTLPPDLYNQFMEDLGNTLVAMPVLGHACVVDRPGYDKRYRETYGRQTWMLCKTAFTVVTERAAKIAKSEGRLLRIFPESGDPSANNKVQGYYREMKLVGMPFAASTSGKYAPLTQAELAQTLYSFRFKNKTSPMAQVADLYLYPICRGSYDGTYYPHKVLREKMKLVDCVLPPETLEQCGIKLSCFDG
jgi:hypothetical protein